jgi:lyso-ornithine lipid O-acyltransferase
MISPVIAVLRLATYVVATILLMIPYSLLVASGWRGHSRFASFYWQVVTRIFGFTIRVHGTPPTTGPALVVANHGGYLDIIILGSVLPACFVAKAEVAGWPGFGWLSRLAQTVFIDRSRGATSRESNAVRNRLEGGEMLILFPEGTSNDGNRVLPFKSSFFAVAERPIADAVVPVHPVSVAYTKLDGQPLQRAFRPFYAWYGDMTLFDHLFAVLGLGNPTIDVIFHPPVRVSDFRDRKALAHHCHDVIAHGTTLALAGRLPPDGIPVREGARNAG